MDWIAVTDRLPTHDICAFVANDRWGPINPIFVTYDHYYNVWKWYSEDKRTFLPVDATHWMEYPTAPFRK